MGLGTQLGVLTPQQIAANARIIGYDKKLRMKSLVEDIYTELSGLYNTEKKTIPNVIYAEVDDRVKSDSTYANITMKLKLRGGAVYGNNFAIGAEERPVTRTTTIYRNNLRKVVTTPGYGVRKLDANAYRLYDQHIDDLADYNKEHEGLEIRQAVVEHWGETLVWGDTQGLCVRNFNRNIFVCGLPLRTCSPAYNNAPAQYSQNIVNRVLASGGGSLTPIVNQTLNQPNLSNASNFALQRRISTLNIAGLPGGKGYVLTHSELQAVYLGDPAWSQRNLGSLYVSKVALPERVQNWPGVMGAYKDLLLVMDPRQPTLLVTGTSAPYGLSALYMWPGDVDERNRDNEEVIDTFFIHGKGSLIKWYPELLHHVQQLDDYGAIVGHGTALVRGIQTPLYVDSATNPTVFEQFTSILGLCRLPDYV